MVLSGSLYAQERGSLGFGFYKACPQNGFDTINYNDGWGGKITYFTRNFSLNDQLSLQFGGRMDFASMDKRDFDPVVLDTPVADMGDLQVRNSMFGLFGVSRLNIGTAKLKPFVELMAGYRAFSTDQYITAQNPSYNPEYESQTAYPNVVQTNRFSYGGSIGFSYQLTRVLILESSITYTEGNAGAVMPLCDIQQSGEVLRYPHRTSETDMLLINAGIRFQFYKIKRSTSSSSGSSTPKKKTIDKTEDDGPPPPPPPPPVKKKKLEVKPPTKPKKIDPDRS